MLYFLHGDFSKATEKAKALVDTLLSKQPNAARFKIDSNTWAENEIEALLHGQGLFSERYIIELRYIFESKDVLESVISFLPEIKESQNIFIWVDKDINESFLPEIEKNAVKVQKFTEQKKIEKPKFNIFSLSDALCERNKQKLWMLFRDALNYFAPEEIHGTLFWQMKNLMLAKKYKTAKEADMKDFLFTKSKSALKKYSEEEIEEMTSKLISVSHDSRRGVHDFEVALERWILSI